MDTKEVVERLTSLMSGDKWDWVKLQQVRSSPGVALSTASPAPVSFFAVPLTSPIGGAFTEGDVGERGGVSHVEGDLQAGACL